MKQRLAAAIVILALGACADTAEEQVEPGEVIEQPVAEQPAGAGTTAASLTLGVDTLEGTGAYLTDGSGRALYLLEGEPEGQSTCYDACAEAWPPVLASQATAAPNASGVQASLIGTMQRRDGSTQLTYGGKALYYYRADQGPGEAKGQDVTDQWGEWYLVKPTGGALEGHGS